MVLYVHRGLTIDLELTKQNNDQHICMSASMLSWIVAERMQAENLHFWRGMFNTAFQEDVSPFTARHVVTSQQCHCECHCHDLLCAWPVLKQVRLKGCVLQGYVYAGILLWGNSNLFILQYLAIQEFPFPSRQMFSTQWLIVIFTKAGSWPYHLIPWVTPFYIASFRD